MKQAQKALLTAVCASIMSAGITFDRPYGTSYDNNPERTAGSKRFKQKKKRNRTANKSKRANRRKR